MDFHAHAGLYPWSVVHDRRASPFGAHWPDQSLLRGKTPWMEGFRQPRAARRDLFLGLGLPGGPRSVGIGDPIDLTQRLDNQWTARTNSQL